MNGSENTASLQMADGIDVVETGVGEMKVAETKVAEMKFTAAKAAEALSPKDALPVDYRRVQHGHGPCTCCGPYSE